MISIILQLPNHLLVSQHLVWLRTASGARSVYCQPAAPRSQSSNHKLVPLFFCPQATCLLPSQKEEGWHWSSSDSTSSYAGDTKNRSAGFTQLCSVEQKLNLWLLKISIFRLYNPHSKDERAAEVPLIVLEFIFTKECWYFSSLN